MSFFRMGNDQRESLYHEIKQSELSIRIENAFKEIRDDVELCNPVISSVSDHCHRSIAAHGGHFVE